MAVDLLSVDEARRRIMADVVVTKSEPVALEKALGRVTAKPIQSLVTQPPFDASSMDGYALRLDDAGQLPATLRLAGASAAGHPYSGEVGAGEAVRIFTGAVMPKGAGVIALQEDCEAGDDGIVTVREAGEAGQYLRPRGYDFSDGEVMIGAGVSLGFRHLSLLASMNVPLVPVRRRPRVAIIATGDELVAPGSTLTQGQIVSSIPHGMAALIEQAGGEPVRLGIARDDLTHLDEMIGKAADADILVTIGGASVGDHDLVQEALGKAGMALDFWRIAMRPGKPLMVGRLNNQRVVGVPGNPVSALVCCLLFVVPLIRGMLGLLEVMPPVHQAVLQAGVPENGPRQHYMRAVYEISASGQLEVMSLEDQDSSLQALFAKATALIVRPPHAPPAEAGERVGIILLDGQG